MIKKLADVLDDVAHGLRVLKFAALAGFALWAQYGWLLTFKQ